jgi:hypothetical protein
MGKRVQLLEAALQPGVQPGDRRIGFAWMVLAVVSLVCGAIGAFQLPTAFAGNTAFILGLALAVAFAPYGYRLLARGTPRPAAHLLVWIFACLAGVFLLAASFGGSWVVGTWGSAVLLLTSYSVYRMASATRRRPGVEDWHPRPEVPLRLFISYRRQDSAHITDRIYEYLQTSLPNSKIFRDVDSLALGTDFPAEIARAVQDCDALLAVIGPGWVGATDEHGNLRLKDPGDFVRLEIEAALSRQIPVIPLLVGGAAVPKEASLPDPLRKLPLLNGLAVRPDPDFRSDMARLVGNLINLRAAQAATASA